MNSAPNTALVKKTSLKDYIESPEVKKRISKLMGSRDSQFIVTLMSMVNNDAKLQECEPASLFTAALTVVALDLPVNSSLGFAWIIPYKDRKSGKTHAQAQLGYKAFIQLAMRSDKFKTLNVSEVKQGEYSGIDRLSGELSLDWIDDEVEREKLPVVGYVAYFLLKNGFSKSLYMSVQEAKKHGLKYSAGFKKYNSGMWVDEFDAMAKKTVLKLLLSRYAPMSTEMAKAQEVDQAVLLGDKVNYIDNKRLSSAEISEDKERQRLIKYIKNSRSIKSLEMCKSSCNTDELQELYLEKEKKLLEKNQPTAPTTVEKKGDGEGLQTEIGGNNHE